MTSYQFTLTIGYPGATHEEEMTIEEMDFNEVEWEELTEDEREKVLQENWEAWSSNFIEGGWEITQ